MIRAALVVVALGLAASGAGAEPLAGADLRQRIAGGELRFSGSGFYLQYENHLYRFAPNGRAEGHIHYTTTGRHSHYVEIYDTGRWRVEGDDRVCVTWNEIYWHIDNVLCFTLAPREGAFVDIATSEGRRYLGTLH